MSQLTVYFYIDIFYTFIFTCIQNITFGFAFHLLIRVILKNDTHAFLSSYSICKWFLY